MLKEKYSRIVTIIFMCLAILITSGISFISNISVADEKQSRSLAYEDELFNGQILDIQVVMDEKSWQELLDNAQEEQYSVATVIINGQKFSNVGIRPKGNSSLTQVVSDDSTDKFSFKIKFDEFVDDQTCYGLDTLVLNNMLGDSSSMKEYLAFDMMHFLEVDSSCYNYASFTVNGESFGFYLALEGYNDSFLQRIYGTSNAQLYSVKTMEMGAGGMQGAPNGMPSIPEQGNVSEGITNTSEERDRIPSGEMGAMPQGEGMHGMMDNQKQGNLPDDFKNMPNRNQGGVPGGMPGGKNANGADLKYSDDNLESYSSILNNAVGSKTKESDKEKVIEAIKALNEGVAIEEYWNVDQILRYLAVHTVMVNMDSYSSSMCQNYYLVEKDGKMSVLPWDYGLSLGGMNGEDISQVINFPIDTPVSGVKLSERPLIAKLFEQGEYLARYHGYLQQLVDGYLNEVHIRETVGQLQVEIGQYIEKEQGSFYTYEEYEEASDALIELMILRGESIKGQLDGSIPSTTVGQQANQESLISKGETDFQLLMSGMGKGRDKDRQGDMERFEGKAPDRNTMPPDRVIQNSGVTNGKEKLTIVVSILLLGAAGVWLKIYRKHRI